jgi:hypothetical protein
MHVVDVFAHFFWRRVVSRISAYRIWGFNDEASLSITWSASASKFNSKQAVFGYVHVADEVAHYRLADAAPLLQFSPTGSKKAADMQLKGLLIARRDLVKAHAVAASVGPRTVWLSRNHHGIVTVADDFDDAEEAQAQAHTLAVAQVHEDALPHFPGSTKAQTMKPPLRLQGLAQAKCGTGFEVMIAGQDTLGYLGDVRKSTAFAAELRTAAHDINKRISVLKAHIAAAQELKQAAQERSSSKAHVQAKTETGGASEISDITAPMEAQINAAVLAALEYATRRRGTARSRRRDTRKRKIADREDAGTAALHPHMSTSAAAIASAPTGSLLPLTPQPIW